ncbi:MnhB domain-containing protein [Thioalkalivibrio sp.]|uniref:MnhB domain-containing protein n=1 Tax=Thioalkalivibrio sp. TaxID=2093813 RepID=UPI0035633AB1
MIRRVVFAGLLCLGVTAALGWAVLERPMPVENLPERVASAMPESGVEHPITAVLLNFRSYDTLLEIAVLLLAVVVALALREAQPDRPEQMGLDNPLLRAVMAWLLPLMLIVAGFLLWAGAYQPGGAFQAGSVLAAAGVLLRLAGVSAGWLDNAVLVRAGLALGLLTFLGIGMLVMLAGVPFLTYPAAHAGTLILVIELTLTLSIGLTLLSLFRLNPPYADDPDDSRTQEAPKP